MAESTVVKNFRDGTIVLSDGTGTPVTYTVTAEAGDLKIGGLNGSTKSYERSVYEDRGEFYSIRKAKQKYPTFGLTAHFRGFTGAAGSGTVLDFLLKQNAYSGNVSTLGSSAEVYTLKIALTVEGSDHGDGADHSVTMNNCVIDDVNFSEGDPNTLEISGRVLGTTTYTGIT